MKQELISYLKTSAAKHVFAIALAALALLVGHSWLAEHDARLLADQAVKTAQVQITALQQEKTEVSKAAKVQVIRLQEQSAEVKTAPQAIAEIPKIAPIPLNVQALPDAPSAVSVQAVPLYQTLNKVAQDEVNLDACNKKLDLQNQIDAGKDTQITALKHKSGFWHRVKSTAITLGIGAATGYALAHR